MKLSIGAALASSLLLFGCPSLSSLLDGDGGSTKDGGSSNDGGSTGDGGVAACGTLDEIQCHARPDCVADSCNTCTCGSGFAGCRAPSDPPAMCPEVACPDLECCRAGGDCTGGKQCELPVSGTRPCGGACFVGGDTCSSDSECNAHDPTMICGPSPCGCGGSENHCIEGCSDDSNPCPDGQVCGSTHRCAPRYCSADAPCPTDFVCTPSYTCQRQACSHDTDCAWGGFCVEGQCYRSQGTCSFPPPLPQ